MLCQITNTFFPRFQADSFETMLKSLLGYQAGMGGGGNESVMRKKLYESAINNSLKSNFSIVVKVCTSDEILCSQPTTSWTWKLRALQATLVQQERP